MNKKLTSMALAVSSCFGAGHVAADEDSRVLSPVVVTATRVEQDSFDLPMAIDKVDRQNIDNQLRMTLSESLARIPGITAQNRNQMAQDPQISSRGFGARSSFGVRGIRVYVDGIPLSMPDGIGNPGSVDLDAIGSIEVMRGPFSAMYGNSSGGVLQLLTKKPGETPVVGADVLFGSFNTRRESIEASGVNGAWSTSSIFRTTHRTGSGPKARTISSKRLSSWAPASATTPSSARSSIGLINLRKTPAAWFEPAPARTNLALSRVVSFMTPPVPHAAQSSATRGLTEATRKSALTWKKQSTRITQSTSLPMRVSAITCSISPAATRQPAPSAGAPVVLAVRITVPMCASPTAAMLLEKRINCQ